MAESESPVMQRVSDRCMGPTGGLPKSPRRTYGRPFRRGRETCAEQRSFVWPCIVQTPQVVTIGCPADKKPGFSKKPGFWKRIHNITKRNHMPDEPRKGSLLVIFLTVFIACSVSASCCRWCRFTRPTLRKAPHGWRLGC